MWQDFVFSAKFQAATMTRTDTQPLPNYVIPITAPQFSFPEWHLNEPPQTALLKSPWKLMVPIRDRLRSAVTLRVTLQTMRKFILVFQLIQFDMQPFLQK